MIIGAVKHQACDRMYMFSGNFVKIINKDLTRPLFQKFKSGFLEIGCK